MTVASILWTRLDTPGHDACRLIEQHGGWELEGTAVFVKDGTPARLDYHIDCDASWRTRTGRVQGWIGARSLDLDLALTGRLDDLLVTDSTFKILKGANAVNPNPFNCSVMLLRAGAHPEVWTDFSLEKANAVPFHEFPDDQGWIWHKLPNADTWPVGAESGIYGFHKPGWPQGIYNYGLPNDARIVAFIGKRKPEMYSGLSWMKKYWRDV